MRKPVIGYTLLELMVVLLILSLLTALAVPRLLMMYDTFQAAYIREEVLSHLNSLNYLAFQQGRDFTLITYPAPVDDKNLNVDKLPFELPEGWQLHTETPIRFRNNGVCSGGIAYLRSKEHEFRMQLVPPFCQVQWIDSRDNLAN